MEEEEAIELSAAGPEDVQASLTKIIQRFFEEEEVARLIHRTILKESVDEVEQRSFWQTT